MIFRCISQNGFYQGINGIDKAHFPKKDGRNARSLGFFFKIGSFTLYTAGDLTSHVESKISEAFSALGVKAKLVKLSHHGSNTSNPQSLLDALEPQAIVSSHGTWNTNHYGHPHIEVVDRAFSSAVRRQLTYLVFTNPLHTGCIQGQLQNCNYSYTLINPGRNSKEKRLTNA